jgi:hypothetical protein
MRPGVGERHARARHQEREAGDVILAAGRQAEVGRRARQRLGLVVERQHLGAGGLERPRGG